MTSLQTFKDHPLVLNYDHLNASLDNPWQPKVEEVVGNNNLTGNTTVIVKTVTPHYPNTALLSMCLMLGCFFSAFFLRQFKNGTFLPGKVSWVLRASAVCFSKVSKELFMSSAVFVS